MKKFLLFITGMLFLFIVASAQSPYAIDLHPVFWHYHTERTGDETYAFHLTAIIAPGWHLYSQKQPEDAIALPTNIMFNDNPLVVFDGKPKEVGRLQVFKEPALGISAYQYEGKVDFVQIVKLKKPVPVKIIGSITFQGCKDEECLPPATKEFHLLIKE